MSLETIISSALPQPDEELNALVLMGGGARTAYQAGVLHALSSMLSLQGGTASAHFPFKILVGTSAGALNATFLASRASEGLTTPRFIGKLYDEVLGWHGEVANFTSMLRVTCTLYLRMAGRRAPDGIAEPAPARENHFTGPYRPGAAGEHPARAGGHGFQLQQRGALDVLPDGRSKAGRFVEPTGAAG